MCWADEMKITIKSSIEFLFNIVNYLTIAVIDIDLVSSTI